MRILIKNLELLYKMTEYSYYNVKSLQTMSWLVGLFSWLSQGSTNLSSRRSSNSLSRGSSNSLSCSTSSSFICFVISMSDISTVTVRSSWRNNYVDTTNIYVLSFNTQCKQNSLFFLTVNLTISDIRNPVVLLILLVRNLIKQILIHQW